ncbi:unnamed protein product [Trifolium pratense]|uniref:Uncharacterized protein n=1 Tax=Trifolium pratense TaxID=57577 RepID=A0ACB0J097_TRIPR|nr:unnamed protein product [Trifolium pratense]
MGVLKAVGVEKVYSRNGSESKMIPIELNYDGMLGKSATPSPGISLLKDTSKVSNEDDFLNLTPMATIEGVKDCSVGNLADIPEEIGDLVDKSYLFKVETNVDPSSMYEKSFKVKKIVADPVLIEKFKAKYVESLKNNIAGDEGVVDAEDTNVVGDDGILNHTKRDNVVDGVSLKDDNTTAEVTQKNNIAGDEGVVDAEDANVVGDDGILNHTERDNIVDGVGLKDHKTTAEVTHIVDGLGPKDDKTLDGVGLKDDKTAAEVTHIVDGVGLKDDKTTADVTQNMMASFSEICAAESTKDAGAENTIDLTKDSVLITPAKRSHAATQDDASVFKLKKQIKIEKD